MRILVLHGANLRLLGMREPTIYGTATLADINRQLEEDARTLGCELTIHQSNHEGQLLDWIEEYRTLVDGCVINPGSLTHTSVALLDAVLAFGHPTVEVHLSEPRDREEFRHRSFVGDACAMRFAGAGLESYREGLAWLVGHLRGERA